MLIVLADDHKEHLGFLASVNPEVVGEFCKIAMDFIRKGTNTRIYSSAAQRLSVDVETVRHGVEGLIFLLTESAKLFVSELDFQDSIITMAFSAELNKQLLELYLGNRKEIRTVLSEMAMTLPQYGNLEWRLDVQLSSRTLAHEVQPNLLLKLDLKQPEAVSHLLQADPANLVHMTSVLETALAELKTAHCRRIIRNIK